MCPESRLVSQIRKILATPVAKARASEFRFSTTQATTDHNLAIFEKNDFKFTKVMRSHQGSNAWYGSELRNWKLVELIFTNYCLIWVRERTIKERVIRWGVTSGVKGAAKSGVTKRRCARYQICVWGSCE
jgi:hypothetical protein